MTLIGELLQFFGIDAPWPPAACPNCGAGRRGPRGLHWHSLTAWCLGCGWAKNR